MLSDGFVAIGGFADLWLYSGREFRERPRGRDFRAEVVAAFPCETCGAPAGHPCRRPTIAGVAVLRRLPHFGRGSARRSAHNTYVRRKD